MDQQNVQMMWGKERTRPANRVREKLAAGDLTGSTSPIRMALESLHRDLAGPLARQETAQ